MGRKRLTKEQEAKLKKWQEISEAIQKADTVEKIQTRLESKDVRKRERRLIKRKIVRLQEQQLDKAVDTVINAIAQHIAAV